MKVNELNSVSVCTYYNMINIAVGTTQVEHIIIATPTTDTGEIQGTAENSEEGNDTRFFKNLKIYLLTVESQLFSIMYHENFEY